MNMQGCTQGWVRLAGVVCVLLAAGGTGFAATQEAPVPEIVKLVDPMRLREAHMQLASEIHVAGTVGDAHTIERLEQMFASAGLTVRRHDIWPLLCLPVSAELSIVSPVEKKLEIQERVLKEDADSAGSAFGWNAYSGSGEVQGRVVYANYGTRQDFEELKKLGVDVAGAIVLTRYGGNYRGFKVKFAQQAGAAGIIIFTDPGDSGFGKGPVYPAGGYANDCCIQRGSILTMPYQGDPLTPGREATEDAKRLAVEDVPLPRIPCQPIGYAAAKEILSGMNGAAAPSGWQGGLGFEYRLTSDGEQAGVRVKMSVKQERAVKHTANVVAELVGTEHPEQRVIIGAHHDAWNHGAADPLCGTIAVVEAARVFGELARRGIRPKRTLVFAAWAAEEFGIIGSSEWVEGNEKMLIDGGVAYINLDMASMGPQFGASATPSMHRAILEAAKVVPQAGDSTRTVYADWASRSALVPGVGLVPVLGPIGGGSDHVGFIARAGIASASFGGGGSSGWSYHSAYDTLPWYWKVVGSDYEPAAMIARMAAVVGAEFAFESAPVVSPGEYGRVGVAALVKAQKVAGEVGLDASRLEELKVALVELSMVCAAGTDLATSMKVDRAWLEEEGRGTGDEGIGEGGLERRPWFLNDFGAPDESTGYDAWVLPRIQAALEQKSAAEFDRACRKTLERIEAAVKAAKGG